jgi:MFS family permease
MGEGKDTVKRSLLGAGGVPLGRDMKLILLTMVLANIGTSIDQRFFPLYVTDLGASPTAIGLIATIVGVFATVLSPVGGWAVDRYRRVTLYALGPIIGAIGVLLVLLAPTWGWVIPGYVISSLPGLLVGPALFGLVSDLGSEETRGYRFALQAVAGGICGAIGPILGGYIYQYLGYRAFLVGQAGMLVLAGIIRTKVRDPREARRRETGYHPPSLVLGLRQAVRQMVASARFRAFLVMVVLFQFAASAVGSLTSVFMREVVGVTEGQMGVLFTLAGVASIVGGLAGGVASDRIGKRPVFAIAIFGFSLGMACLVAARSMAALTLVFVFQGLAVNLASPVLQSYFAEVTDTENRGTSFSVFNSLLTLLFLPAPLVGGLIWDNVGPIALVWFAVILSAAGGVVALAWLKETRQPPGASRSAVGEAKTLAP